MSFPIPETKNLFANEQYRMCKLQVFNWGTFSNLHDITIAERGYLFVGRSGAGKSTLLDAFSALLVPAKWIDFNAAAREADRSGRDRSLVTYVRGAWSEQKDNESGLIATQFLRTGSTWSALALSYQNPLGQTVVLVQLIWIKGNSNNNADIRRHYLIFERAFDLREIQNFDLNIRTIKSSFPEVTLYDEFRPYCERFRRLLGIESEMALRLLHKTQSAKNLGDLNTFLRDFMLDKPSTFEVAERLVAEFSELNAAHQAVVIAREQVNVLAPAQQAFQLLAIKQHEKSQLDELKLGLDRFCEIRRQSLLETEIKHLEIKVQGYTGTIQKLENELTNLKSTLDDLAIQHNDLGGNHIAKWETERKGLELQLVERLRKMNLAQEHCNKLNWSLPNSPHAFAELVGKARQELENSTQQNQDTREKQYSLVAKQTTLTHEFDAIKKEVRALKKQSSNMPADMLELRSAITAALGLHESALPFVGELIEVQPQEVHWQGAIERVLRGFAMSLLVEDKHYDSLSNYINATHLGKRLVYLRIGKIDTNQSKIIASQSLLHKLIIKDGNHRQWLETELKTRFDYICVDNLQAFRNSEKAITLQGQIRHSITRHEKDDRRQVNDRMNWVLGFDNRPKLALCEKQAQSLADSLSQINKELNDLSDKEKQRTARELLCQTLANMQWQEIDASPLADRIKIITQSLDETMNSNVALKEINLKIIEQRVRIEKTEEDRLQSKIKLGSTEETIKYHQKKLSSLQATQTSTVLTSHQLQELTARFAELRKQPTIDNLDELSKSIERALGAEITTLINEHNRLEKAIENAFSEFKRKWPMDSSDMDVSIESAPDFFAKLHRLETDGLPAHE